MGRKQGGIRLEEIGPGLTEEGPVEVVQAPSGGAYFRPAIRPKAWDRLSPGAQDEMAELQLLAAKIHELQGDLEERALSVRRRGASWALIGWALGTSGQAAQKRWGGDA